MELTAKDVVLPRGMLNPTYLPAMCVLTGGETELTWKNRKFQWYPKWINWTVFPVPMIAIVLMQIHRRIESAQLPMDRRAWLRLMLLRGGLIIVALMGFGWCSSLMAAEQIELGLLVFSLTLLTMLVTAFWLRRIDLQCVSISETEVVVRFPKEMVAQQFQAALKARSSIAESIHTAAASCSSHTEVQATATCSRCGLFLCRQCIQSSPSSQVVYCAACFQLAVEQPVLEGKRRDASRMALAALVIGGLSMIPGAWGLTLASIIVNVMASTQFRQIREIKRLWMVVLGSTLTVLGILLNILVLGAALSEN